MTKGFRGRGIEWHDQFFGKLLEMIVFHLERVFFKKAMIFYDV